eukprot:gene17596-20651_t
MPGEPSDRSPCRTGSPFFNGTFGLAEALVAPFVIRMLVNTKHHRGVDLLAQDDLPGTVAWMRAIREHPSCTPKEAEAAFAASIDAGLKQVGKQARDRSVESARNQTTRHGSKL